jgi:anti-anti-sigma factor
VFEVVAEIDLSCAADFERELRTSAEFIGGPFAVSLERCAYIDSSGLAVLVRVRKQHPDMILVVPAESPARRVFEITGLARSMDVADSADEAVRRLTARGDAR